MRSEDLISSNKVLLKAEKGKEFWKFFGISSTIIHKTEHATFIQGPETKYGIIFKMFFLVQFLKKKI